MEHENKQVPITEQFTALLELEPKPVAMSVPDDVAAQREAFLSGEVTEPHHTYSKLDAIDFDQRKAEIARQGADLLNNPAMNPKFRAGYEEFVQTYLDKTVFMEKAHAYNHATDPDEKEAAAREFMQKNIEIYGAPDQQIYKSLLSEKLAKIRAMELTGRAKEIADELFSMVDIDETEYPKRFQPNQETIEWVRTVADALYANMLKHIPQQEEFSNTELRDLSETIIQNEFGDAASDWKVILDKDTKTVMVKATEKLVVVPDNDRDKGYGYELVRGLVKHELGFHMMRAIMGGETDLDPLSTGLSNYYDAEEGLAMCFEQAEKGEYKEAGVGHYITAGLAYFDQKSFREIHDVKWRLSILEDMTDESDITDKQIYAHRKSAYNETYRIMRGTDDLPWFKDLAYYNGAKEMWQHLETICGDDLKLMFLFLGKANPADGVHERLMYETATVR